MLSKVSSLNYGLAVNQLHLKLQQMMNFYLQIFYQH